MKLAFFGDVVGRSGREAVKRHLPHLKSKLDLDAVVINAENAAGGFGVTRSTADELFEAGADVLTLGNHSFDQAQGISLIENEPRILRPCNYPIGQVPGRGAGLFDIKGYNLLVINVHGRVFMDALDDPFIGVERELSAAPLGDVADAVIVDMHAEATSEKMAMGHHCDGRASMVVGSHTHVPTADHMILADGTAYQSDAGMCGDYDSVIGMQKDNSLRRFSTQLPGQRYEPALGDGSLCGLFVETDDATGLAKRCDPIRIGGRLSEMLPRL